MFGFIIVAYLDLKIKTPIWGQPKIKLYRLFPYPYVNVPKFGSAECVSGYNTDIPNVFGSHVSMMESYQNDCQGYF